MFAPSCGEKIAHPCERRTRDVGLHLRRQPFSATPSAGTTDLTISACAHDFCGWPSAGKTRTPLFFNRRLSMEGDTELGLVVKDTLDGLELPVFDLQQWTPPQVLARIMAKHRAGTGSHAEGRP